MESIQKIILIAGIPSSGKTIFSRKLKDIFDIDIICTDDIYYKIADDLKIGGIQGFPNCSEWWGYDKNVIYACKMDLYKKALEKVQEQQIIVEGFGLAFRDDREIIKNLYPEAKIFFLYKKVNYQQWLFQKNIKSNKLDCDRTKMEYEDLMNMLQPSNEMVII